MGQFSMGYALPHCNYKLKTTNKIESIYPMQLGHARLHHEHTRAYTFTPTQSCPWMYPVCSEDVLGWTQFAVRMRLADYHMKLTGRTMTGAPGIRLNISQFSNKCIEDKKEKTYTKQLESSFLRQIFVLNKSNCRGTCT
jgi:hypothetical protein